MSDQKKYRPSNGIEGEFFMENFCYRCRHDDIEEGRNCPIATMTWIFGVEDSEYPNQWVRHDDGIGGYCTAFEAE